MTDEELVAYEDERDELEAAIAEIKAQIGAAKAKVLTDGTYADASWYAKAMAALRFKGARHQLVLRRLGAENKTRKQRGSRSFEQKFIEAARRTLNPETFESLREEASSDVEPVPASEGR